MAKDLTITQILGIDDKVPQKVWVESWNGNVYVRIMSAEERSELEDIYMKVKQSSKGTGTFRKELLKRVLCDKEGSLMLTDDAHATQFMKKNSLAIETIFEAGCEVNGFREKDVETLKKK